MLEDIRRRNRWRLLVLSVFAAVNLWVVVTALVVLVAELYSAAPFATLLRIFGPICAALIGMYVVGSVYRSGQATLAELDAVEIEPTEWPRTPHVVEQVLLATGLPNIRVAAVEDPVPNALTVGAGRRHTVLIITTGLVEQLTRDELEAVIAVQLCSVARLDVAVRTMVVACASGTLLVPQLIADHFADVWYPTIVKGLTWPCRAAARSMRKRAYEACDFGADEMAIAITRYPDALRGALVHMLEDERIVGHVTEDNAPLWFEPVPYVDGDRAQSLARHSMAPSLEDRIARLDELTRPF